jgi:hypothetical protein
MSRERGNDLASGTKEGWLKIVQKILVRSASVGKREKRSEIAVYKHLNDPIARVSTGRSVEGDGFCGSE